MNAKSDANNNNSFTTPFPSSLTLTLPNQDINSLSSSSQFRLKANYEDAMDTKYKDVH